MSTTKCVLIVVLVLVVAVAGLVGVYVGLQQQHLLGADSADSADNASAVSSMQRRSAGSQQIPSERMREIYNMDYSRFLASDMVLITDPEAEEEHKLMLAGRTNNERSKSMNSYLLGTGCNTTYAVVPLNLPDDAGEVLYSNRCARVQRCSGCCWNPDHECTAVRSEMVVVDVRQSVFNSSTNRFHTSIVPVTVEEHYECDCTCRRKESSCNRLQQYDETDCTCTCTNESERSRCLENSMAFWDDETCKCTCHDEGTAQCPIGYHFDVKKCQCVQKKKSFWQFW